MEDYGNAEKDEAESYVLCWKEDMIVSEKNWSLSSMIIFLYETYMYMHRNCGSTCTEQLKMVISGGEIIVIFIFDFLFS